jgi:hypothetical protein
MPALPQYEARAADRGLQPNNIGMEARAQEGRRIGAFGQQEAGDIDQLGRVAEGVASQWEEHTTFQQMSAGMANAATNYNASLQSFAQMLKDPSVDKGDPTLARTAVEQFKASQEQIGKGFTTEAGQRWWAEHSAEQLDRFQQTVIGQTSQYAGIQAHQNLMTAAGARAQTVMQDPTQVKGALDDTEHGYLGMAATATIDAATGARIPELVQEDSARVALAGAQGAIYNAANKAALSGVTDPDAIRTQVHAALDTYISSDGRLSGLLGEHMEGLSSKADEVARSASYDARAAAEAKTKADRQDFEKAATQLYTAGMRSDGTWAPPQNYSQTLTALANMPGADFARIHDMQEAGQQAVRSSITGEYVQTDPGVKSQFMKAIGVPPDQPGALTEAKIIHAEGLGLLSHTDAAMFREAIGKPDPGRAQAWGQAERVVESFKSTFTKSVLGSVVDYSGDQAYGRFQQAAYDLFQAEIRTKSPAEAEQDMSNPSSPNYIGKLVARLVPTAQDRQRDLATWAGGSAGGNPGGPNPLAMPK